jgi:hypothetical protein
MLWRVALRWSSNEVWSAYARVPPVCDAQAIISASLHRTSYSPWFDDHLRFPHIQLL